MEEKRYINQFDTTEKCSEFGKLAEDLFQKFLINNRIFFRKATQEEQFNHIDFIYLHDKTLNPCSVEIKYSKKINRTDMDVSPDYMWVEFKNVCGGKGWLFGNSDYTAFYDKFKNKFIMVETARLRERCIELCNQGTTDNKSDALYKHYTREGRQDDISLVKIKDLEDIARAIFDPNKELDYADVKY